MTSLISFHELGPLTQLSKPWPLEVNFSGCSPSSWGQVSNDDAVARRLESFLDRGVEVNACGHPQDATEEENGVDSAAEDREVGHLYADESQQLSQQVALGTGDSNLSQDSMP